MSGPLIFFYLVERYTHCDISVIQVCLSSRFIKQFSKKGSGSIKGNGSALINLKNNLILY
ncbi:hypothetical protein BCBMB205_07730 [Bacillus sp. CN2]|nr:hypothetical protein BCBMB205_07730 [Bacillus velezensis]ARZ57100.1 hypothetical protein BAGQ_0845 [Bacillus velezensis]GFR57000.1 hypothetical protein BCBMB205_07730 [Bacillus sp. CN2]